MTSVLVVGRAWELDPSRRIWGTGGWTSPEEREARDWLTLVRLLGWSARTATAVVGDRPDVCLLATDPAQGTGEARALLEWARRGTTVVVPSESAPAPLVEGLQRGPLSRGGALAWTGEDPATWPGVAPEHAALVPGRGWEALAEVDGRPAVVRRRHGSGSVVVAGFHPSAARDASGSATALLVHLLTRTAPAPLAWLDLSRTIVLRMDDPGGAQNVYSRDWCYPKLGSAQWRAVGGALARRRGRISVAYSAGFVDDGDARRGQLSVDGRGAVREPGRVHPSPVVRYEDVAGHAPGAVYDYRDEFAGIASLVASGLAGVELHGHTHVHPDHAAWAAAPDRYDSLEWYRELGPRAAPALARLAPGDHPLARGAAEIERWFGRRPSTLVCPGEEWTDEALEVSLDAGLSLVGSYYLALRHDGRLCWTTHVCSPYLDEPSAGWFDSPLPVVGYMHDRDLVVEGVEWLDEWLSAWETAGATRFVDYAYLAALLDSPVTTTRGGEGWLVNVAAVPAGQRVRVGVRTGAAGDVTVAVGARTHEVVTGGGTVIADCVG